ncbi:MON1B isoform 6 [Pan troglodytes]|uniref:MON1B isoform 6 n=1 Tax=Pan troglodytes TaxID=9598 RepID=A0A2J8Q653_PANTR|nr:MON1B isoform 6 [Pan troglodytes]
MEVGGDTAAPAPGGAEDLEDTQFPSEEAREGGGVHAVPPDPEDEGLEETGAPFQDPRTRTSHPAHHHRPSQRACQAPLGSGVLQPLRIVPHVALRVALEARAGTPVMRSGAASGSMCLC